MRTRHITFMALAGALVMFHAPGAVTADNDDPSVWVFTPLPTGPDWTWSWGQDINDTGRCVGQYSDPEHGARPVFWEGDRYYDLIEFCGAPSGFESAQGIAESVNNSGLIGGDIWIPPLRERGLLWDVKNHTYTDKHPPEMYASGIWGINEPGDACGFVVDWGGDWSVPPQINAYFYSHDGRDDRKLSTGDLAWSWAFAVNAAGTVAGALETPWENRAHAAVWKKTGELLDIHPALAALDPRVFDRSVALGIHENGTVVGRLFMDDEGTEVARAFEWTATRGARFLDSDDYRSSTAWKTTGGWTAGRVGARQIEGRQDAAIWVNGRLEVLPALPDFPAGIATGVNRKGVVIGNSGALDDTSSNPDNFDVCWAWTARKVAP